MKICFKCKEKKCLSEFYKHSRMRDGHLNKCKDCTKKDATETRNKNISYYREYDRNRGNRQTQKYVNEYRKRFPLASRARAKLAREVKKGNVKKTPCEFCGEVKVVGHHDDYTKFTDVRWLCSSCHSDWHKKNGEGLNKRMSIEEFESLKK